KTRAGWMQRDVGRLIGGRGGESRALPNVPGSGGRQRPGTAWRATLAAPPFTRRGRAVHCADEPVPPAPPPGVAATTTRAAATTTRAAPPAHLGRPGR